METGGQAVGVEDYRAGFLSGLMKRHAGPDSSILEVGARSGNNLDTLYDAGFSDLAGIERQADRIEEMELSHKEIGRSVVIMQGEPADRLEGLGDGEYEVVFSVGFFETHDDHTRTLRGMARVASRAVITVEQEGPGSSGIDFADFFQQAGFEERESRDLREVPELESVFTVRAFSKTVKRLDIGL